MAEQTLAAADCKECGHPVGHHDAGECWTNPDETESVENTCGCRWYEPIEHPKQETPECT